MKRPDSLPLTLMVPVILLVVSYHMTSHVTSAQPISGGKFLLANMVEPPVRPEHFRNLEELNEYLSELRQYYTIIGRPR